MSFEASFRRRPATFAVVAATPLDGGACRESRRPEGAMLFAAAARLAAFAMPRLDRPALAVVRAAARSRVVGCATVCWVTFAKSKTSVPTGATSAAVATSSSRGGFAFAFRRDCALSAAASSSRSSRLERAWGIGSVTGAKSSSVNRGCTSNHECTRERRCVSGSSSRVLLSGGPPAFHVGPSHSLPEIKRSRPKRAR